MHRANLMPTQVVGGVQIKAEYFWDEEAWQNEFNALPFMPGVDDAYIKEEDLSDEEPWHPEVPQAPLGLLRQREGSMEPARGIGYLSRPTKITAVVDGKREYSLEAEYGIICIGFGLVLALVLVLMLVLVLVLLLLFLK